MNRELCLVICFFVGVLAYHLLKSSCGCNNVVEGVSKSPAPTVDPTCVDAAKWQHQSSPCINYNKPVMRSYYCAKDKDDGPSNSGKLASEACLYSCGSDKHRQGCDTARAKCIIEQGGSCDDCGLAKIDNTDTRCDLAIEKRTKFINDQTAPHSYHGFAIQ